MNGVEEESDSNQLPFQEGNRPGPMVMTTTVPIVPLIVCSEENTGGSRQDWNMFFLS
jgi:hypothetical protein